MARIISYGHTKDTIENWLLDCVCTGYGWINNGKSPCGAILELDKSDIFKVIPNKNRLSEVTYGFKCPVCGCKTEIDKSKIPNYIQNIAKEILI